jgi:transposase
MAEGVYMTQKELNRAEVLAKVEDKRLTQRKAAEQLNLSLRQVQRLIKLYRIKGAVALASQKRGRPSNNKLAEATRTHVCEIVKEPHYIGFGPTLLCEKLEELHKIKISRESTRQIMIKCGVWCAKKERRPVIHQQRQRRARLGELLQIDGSPHAWFEDRGKPCSLLVFIDDATGRTYGKFFETETTVAYMQTMSEYITLYGMPLAVYSDKHSIFRINHGQGTKKENFTQFSRALYELDIELIYANSPQAKGRVERANQTLQDRLIKELRLAGISTIKEANQFLEPFWERYNKKFAKMPVCTEDAHRSVKGDISRIMCIKEQRVISKNLEFQFENQIYQVVVDNRTRTPKGMKVTVIKHLDGRLSFECQGKPIEVRKYAEQIPLGRELNGKELAELFRAGREYKVSSYHPWVQAGLRKARYRDYQRA